MKPRLAPWWVPSERQAVTAALFALVGLLLVMAWNDPRLWEVEVYKVVIQATVLTGLLSMVSGFHFAANKSDETKSENTKAAFQAITATAKAGGNPNEPDVMLAPGETAQAENKP